jgi:hypothetical protein
MSPRLLALPALALFLACADAPAPAPKYPTPDAPPAGTVAFTDYTWAPRSRVFVQPLEGCAQSISYALTTVGYRWGEVVTIDAHTDHWIAGQAEMNLGGRISSTFFTSEAHDRMSASDVGDAHRCQANGGVVPLVPVAPGAVPKWDGGDPLSSADGVVRAPAIELRLDASTTSDPRPGVQIFRMDMQHSTYQDDALDAPPVAAGTRLLIKLWGMSPIDWSGVRLEIKTWEIVPNDPVAYRRRVEAERIAHAHPVDPGPHLAECRTKPGAKECADVRVTVCQMSKENLASAACVDVKRDLDDANANLGSTTNTPPPPALAETQPPRPSVNATWVPGHWVYVQNAWSFWSAGFWRVDDEDRAQGRTVTAPSAPPPPRAEPQATEKPPAPTAVWTSGYWAWNAGWQWVAGAWRVPPAQAAGQGTGQGTMTWRPATWRVDVKVTGTFRLDPGGWFPR